LLGIVISLQASVRRGSLVILEVVIVFGWIIVAVRRRDFKEKKGTIKN
jgi:hypothetical protein